MSNGGWRRFGTIRVKILVPVAVILLLLFVLLSTYTGRLASDEAHINLATKAKSVATISSHALGEGLEYADVAVMMPTLDGIRNDPDVSSAIVYDAQGRMLVGSTPDGTVYFLETKTDGTGVLQRRTRDGQAVPVDVNEAAQLSIARQVSLDQLLGTPVVETDRHLRIAQAVMARPDHGAVAEPVEDDPIADVLPPPAKPAQPQADKRVGALAVEFSSANASARAESARVKYALLAAVGLAATMLLLWWIVSRLLEPVRTLTKVATEIVDKGDLTQSIDVRSNDEIGQLALAFSQLVEKLRDIPKRLQESTDMLLASVSTLGKSTHDQSQTVARQASAVQETQVTVQEIKQTSLLAAQKAEAVLRVAERADEVSQRGEVAITQSLGGLADIREQVGEIAQKITELQERTRQIGLITETVKDLADQSNMLALNAAIEAVRSGEHGKGFGVVAREIRNLADQSIQATNRVREILDDITKAIRNAVTITERGAQRMEGGLVQVKQSGESLRELSAIVKDNAAAVRQIAAAVSQQNAGISQIFLAISDLDQMMEETVSQLEHTGKSVETLRDVSTQVSHVVTSFRV